MRYVWLESSDACRQIDGSDSALYADVYASKKDVIRYWKGLGDIEFLTEKDYKVDKNTMAVVWHRVTGENMLRVARRHAVFTYEKEEKKK
jgi:hypothetical protein